MTLQFDSTVLVAPSHPLPLVNRAASGATQEIQRPLAGSIERWEKDITLVRTILNTDSDLIHRRDSLLEEFKTHTGVSLIFDRKNLSPGRYYDKLPALDLQRQARAAEILLEEGKKYPKGFLAKLDLKTIGVFGACVSLENDGYHVYDPQLGGYLWYGLYNFDQGIVAAYYNDAQVKLTFHHEIFHAIDAHLNGKKSLSNYEEDNDRFTAAIRGEKTYPKLAISETDLSALERVTKGSQLQDAVSAYAGKSPDEDQADTARHFMTSLADSLVQAATRPELPGSQRLLHIIGEITKSTPGAPTAQWWIDLALGRHPTTSKSPPRSADEDLKTQPAPASSIKDSPESTVAAKQVQTLLTTITNENRGFIVRGSALDDHTPNPTLQEDIREFGNVADALMKLERLSKGRYSAVEDLAELTGILDAYHAHVDRHFALTPQTGGLFQKTRGVLALALPESIRRNIQDRWHNPHLLKKLDAVLFKAHGDKADFPVIKRAIREAQPSVVWLELATGVIISPDGWVLTNAHVMKEHGKTVKVQLANGDTYQGTCVTIDEEVDLSLVKLQGVTRALPFSRFSPRSLTVGGEIITIGNPDTRLYDGWHVSTGKITEVKESHPWTSPEGPVIGGIIHDSWTYYGNSGSPMYDTRGGIVAMHHWWRAPDRHAIDGVSTIIPWLKKHRIPFQFARE